MGVQSFEFQERLELKSVLCSPPVIACLGLLGPLFTAADKPGAAESPNCFTASLSCVMRSL